VPSKSVKKMHLGLSLRVSGKGMMAASRRSLCSNVERSACRQSREQWECGMYYRMNSEWRHCVVLLKRIFRKNSWWGWGPASSEHVFFSAERRKKNTYVRNAVVVRHFLEATADLVQLVEFDQYEGSRPSFPTVVAVCHSIEVHQP